MMNREYYIENLRLIPHPEGGFFREVYRSGAVPMQSKGATSKEGKLTLSSRRVFEGDDGKRNDLTSIYWLAVKERILLLCRNESDHVHYYLAGAPYQYWTTDPKTGISETAILGPDLSHGHVLQFAVKGCHWKCGRMLESSHDFTLIAEAVAPGFDFHDFSLVSKDELTEEIQERVFLSDFQATKASIGYKGNRFNEDVYRYV